MYFANDKIVLLRNNITFCLSLPTDDIKLKKIQFHFILGVYLAS